MTVTVLGVRHHGPGSAHSVERVLRDLEPDVVLVEGPPEGDAAVPYARDEGLEPPVALLVYARDDPGRALHYPFARFSPEWRALRHALDRDVPFRFIDLPAGASLVEGSDDEERGSRRLGPVERDPIGAIAAAAGYEDPERWWEDSVERAGPPEEPPPFEAVAEAMAALREGVDDPPREQRREAHMRQAIRAATREGFERVAVVCGAWHVPALTATVTQTADAKVLRGLKKARVEATWVPWSYGLLSTDSGYAAGVASPAWYEHLFDAPDEPVAPWLARAAALLREQGLDAASAQVVDAARLATALAALRGRPAAGLPELTEALVAAVTGGSDVPLKLVREKLVVGDRLGAVPDDAPMVPLQADLVRLQRRLRLKPEAGARTLELDLRKDTDRLRSRLLHRLDLLGIPWGEVLEVMGKRGSFHEAWALRWTPQLAIAVIESSRYGTTVEVAAGAMVHERATAASSLADLTALARGALLADLPRAAGEVVAALQERAAAGADVPQLMDGVPPLADVVRYGDVRGSDVGIVRPVLDGIVARVCVGLPLACAALDDDAARDMGERIDAVGGAVALLDEPALRTAWLGALRAVGERAGVHGLVAGRAWRFLLDAGEAGRDRVAAELSRTLSQAADAAAGAAWLEGFLAGSGLVLVHDEGLLGLIDAWLAGLDAEQFETVLPLVRRSFSVLTPPERRQLGGRLGRADRPTQPGAAAALGVDPPGPEAALDLVERILTPDLVAERP